MFTSIIDSSSSNENTIDGLMLPDDGSGVIDTTRFVQGATNAPALTPLHRWADCGEGLYGVERHAALAPLAAAFVCEGARGILGAFEGLRCSYQSRAWALAMTAVYGPVGTREENIEYPSVVKAKARALADLQSYLSV